MLRLGRHKLAIHLQRKERVDRQHRLCRLCNMGGQGQVKEVEDIIHFMPYCGRYADVRARYSRLFDKARVQGGKDADMLQLLFADRDQLELACCVMRCYNMKSESVKPMRRKHNARKQHFERGLGGGMVCKENASSIWDASSRIAT